MRGEEEERAETRTVFRGVRRIWDRPGELEDDSRPRDRRVEGTRFTREERNEEERGRDRRVEEIEAGEPRRKGISSESERIRTKFLSKKQKKKEEKKKRLISS